MNTLDGLYIVRVVRMDKSLSQLVTSRGIGRPFWSRARVTRKSCSLKKKPVGKKGGQEIWSVPALA